MTAGALVLLAYFVFCLILIHKIGRERDTQSPEYVPFYQGGALREGDADEQN